MDSDFDQYEIKKTDNLKKGWKFVQIIGLAVTGSTTASTAKPAGRDSIPDISKKI